MSTGTSDRRKRLYEMTVTELEAEARRYEAAGEAGAYWARLCREQIQLNLAIEENWALAKPRPTQPKRKC
jgi:hypothetical protein